MKLPVKAVMAAIILLSSATPVTPLAARSLPSASLERGEDTAQSADVITLFVEPGMLADLLPSALERGVGGEVLALKGSVDVRDIRALAAILPPSVVEMDLSGLTIKGYTYPVGSSEGNGYFPADELPAWAFFTLPIQRISLPETLKSIGEGALSATRLRSLTVPKGVIAIEDYAFYDSPMLERVELPASLQTLGKGAFGKCGAMRTADLSATALTAVAQECFSGCTALVSVSMPRTPYSVGSQAFRGTGIRQIDLSQGVEFEDYALYGMTALEEVALSPSARFGKGVLMNNASLKDVEGIPAVLPALFAAGCKALETDRVASEAVEIGAWALSGGKARNITLSVADLLAEGALADIAGLEEIDVRNLGSALPIADEKTFVGIETSSVRLIVTDASEPLWRQDPVWGRFNIIPDYIVGASVVASSADSFEISAFIAGGLLHLSSAASPLSSVSLYSPEGMLLASERLTGAEADVILPATSAPYLVVVVKAGDQVKALKIMNK